MSNRLMKVQLRKARRAFRVRAKVSGTAERPRMTVRISNKHVSAQLVDDVSGKTIASSSTVGKKQDAKNLTEKATWAGEDIAKKAIAKKVKKVTLDRGSKLYHGRVKAFAEAAREAGLEL